MVSNVEFDSLGTGPGKVETDDPDLVASVVQMQRACKLVPRARQTEASHGFGHERDSAVAAAYVGIHIGLQPQAAARGTARADPQTEWRPRAGRKKQILQPSQPFERRSEL